MSGIYIPGMEMPKSCLECRLYNDPWCMAKNRNQWRTAYNRPLNGERQDDCPLIHIPPHGRLIDADALRAFKYHDLPYTHIYPPDVKDAESYERGWNDAVDMVIEHAAETIPAEKGEEE